MDGNKCTSLGRSAGIRSGHLDAIRLHQSAAFVTNPQARGPFAYDSPAKASKILRGPCSPNQSKSSSRSPWGPRSSWWQGVQTGKVVDIILTRTAEAPGDIP